MAPSPPQMVLFCGILWISGSYFFLIASLMKHLAHYIRSSLKMKV